MGLCHYDASPNGRADPMSGPLPPGYRVRAVGMEMDLGMQVLWTLDADCSPTAQPSLQKGPEIPCFPWVHAGRLRETLALHWDAVLP